ncbi:MAG: hypothetical protein ACXV4B_04285 [Halobacteriota archaeon]
MAGHNSSLKFCTRQIDARFKGEALGRPTHRQLLQNNQMQSPHSDRDGFYPAELSYDGPYQKALSKEMRHSLTVLPETDAKEGSDTGYQAGPKVFCWRFETDLGKQLISKVSDLGEGFADYPALWEARLLLLTALSYFLSFSYIGTNIQRDAILLGAVFRLFVL